MAPVKTFLAARADRAVEDFAKGLNPVKAFRGMRARKLSEKTAQSERIKSMVAQGRLDDANHRFFMNTAAANRGQAAAARRAKDDRMYSEARRNIRPYR